MGRSSKIMGRSSENKFAGRKMCYDRGQKKRKEKSRQGTNSAGTLQDQDNFPDELQDKDIVLFIEFTRVESL